MENQYLEYSVLSWIQSTRQQRFDLMLRHVISEPVISVIVSVPSQSVPITNKINCDLGSLSLYNRSLSVICGRSVAFTGYSA